MMVLAPILISIPTIKQDTFDFAYNLSLYAHAISHYGVAVSKNNDSEIMYTKVWLMNGFVYFTLLSVYEIEELIRRAAKKLIPLKRTD